MDSKPDLIRNLMEMRNGGVAVTANQHWGTIVKSVVDTGKPGKMAITLTVKPSRVERGEVKEVELGVEFKLTEPKLDPGKTTFFPYKGGLTRHDPAQIEMFEQQEKSWRPVRQMARLRYRISDGGKLTFQYRLHEPHRVAEEAFQTCVRTVVAATGRPVLEGSVAI